VQAAKPPNCAFYSPCLNPALAYRIKLPTAAATTPVIASTAHLTPPLASTPALFAVDDVVAALLVVLPVEVVLCVAAFAGPMTPPCTVAGAWVVTLAALAIYAAIVSLPVLHKMLLAGAPVPTTGSTYGGLMTPAIPDAQ
jgi:hypothetical protein